MTMWQAVLVLVGLSLVGEGTDNEPRDLVFLEGPRMAAPLVEAPDRIDFAISLAPDAEEMQAFFDQGLTQWYGGWPSEAARSFQTILIEDPDCAMAYWGLALANEDWPGRAAWFARSAWLKKGLVSPRERRLIDALAKYHGVDGPDEPAGLREPWNKAPGVDRPAALRRSEQPAPRAGATAALLADYQTLLGEHPEDLELRALYTALLASQAPVGSGGLEAIEAEFQACFAVQPFHPLHARRMAFWLALGEGQKALTSAEVVAQATPAVGKSWFLAAEVLEAAGRETPAIMIAQHGKALTFEHSRRTWQWPSAWTDPRDLESDAKAPQPLRWEPLAAPDWTLTDAYGETHSLKDYRRRPLLIVNFLGFGCVHCLEQLQAIEPVAKRFAEAGIAIVAIGLQAPEDLRVSLGEDPADTGYSFPILCDPKLTQFRAYGAYDDFADTELHGTYLVDPDGGVRWFDISHLPYMEVESILEDAGRLLGPAWKPR
ncbi:MAG: peroxiredoxin [Gammaproteobacteria bacterium]|jgi:peroxiredoxin